LTETLRDRIESPRASSAAAFLAGHDAETAYQQRAADQRTGRFALNSTLRPRGRPKHQIGS
jgi:hypothetical protein